MPAPIDAPAATRASRLLSWAGHLLALAGAGYVGWLLLSNDGLTDVDIRAALLVVPMAALAYASASLLVASGWHMALRACAAPSSWSRSWRIHARAQLAKYLPGNVLHFAGRHVLSRGVGIGHRQLVAAAFIEHLSLVAAALAAAALMLPGALRNLVGDPAPLPTVPLVLGALATALAALWWLAHRFGTGALKAVLAMFALHATFFVATGWIALGVLAQVAPGVADTGPAEVIGAFSAAWIAGFIVPGAPGGLGVREALLVTLLAGAAPASVLSAFAILLRAVTMLGDLLLFLASLSPTPDRRPPATRP